MSPERIAEDGWRNQTGHVWRYEWAAKQLHPGEVVLDVACGVGYGAELMSGSGCIYVGVDLPGIPSATFRPFGRFIETDIERWGGPDGAFDVAVCFETLEHLATPWHLAVILARARRLILVSVPTIPTVGINEWHRHDFEPDTVAGLFPDWHEQERHWQEDERSHVYAFTR